MQSSLQHLMAKKFCTSFSTNKNQNQNNHSLYKQLFFCGLSKLQIMLAILTGSSHRLFLLYVSE